MNRTTLFREEALDGHRVKWLGRIVLARPLSFSFFTALAAILIFAISAFVVTATYTKRTTVSGRLVPNLGVVKVFPPQQGIISRKTVQEGQSVKRGDVLFILSSERQSLAEHGIQESISRQVELRQHSILEELNHTKLLHHNEQASLAKKIDALKAEQLNVLNQLDGQRARVQLAMNANRRAVQLLSKGYISEEFTQQKQAELLDQSNRLQSLERDQINLQRDLNELHTELNNMPLRQKTQLGQIERLLNSTTQELADSEGKRTIAVVAPQSGIATAIMAEIGQAVDANRPLLSIIPAGARLEAQMFAPSSAVGFVRHGDQVMLRYHAFPYQKFGRSKGTVAHISRTSMSEEERLPSPAGVDSLYRITVTLASQTITAYGKAESLKAGMLVEADILQEKRKIYEWILEPLLTISGKI